MVQTNPGYPFTFIRLGRNIMKEKIFSVLLCTLSFSILLLAACTGEIAPTPAPDSPTPTVTPPPLPTATPTPEVAATPTPTATPSGIQPEALRGVRIQFWHSFTGEKEAALLSLVNQFNAENEFAITVVAFNQGNDLYQNVRAAIGLGALPHVTLGYTNQLQSWDNTGKVIVDLNEYLYDDRWGLQDSQRADFYEAVWEQDESAGKRLGLPYYRSAMVIFYNQSWAEALGFAAPPTSPAEFREQACAAAAANNDGTGGWIASTDASTTLSWIYAFGGDVLAPDSAGYQFDTPAAAEALAFIKDLFESGCAWFPEARYPNWEFATRQGLFYTSSIAGLPFQLSVFEDAHSADQWTALAYPAEDGESALAVYGSAFAVFNSTPEEQLASWLFVRWMSEPENQAQFIAASDYWPTRASVVDHLEEYIAENPQWSAALEWIPASRAEPGLGSWGVARWAVDSAVEQLLDPGYAAEEIPALLATLDATLSEIHQKNP
jgi:ABC-type glycerol-3-phosphate transport system substrate-binding protein